jgi:large subunit ribosomal protein L19
MSQALLQKYEAKYAKSHPAFNAGDTVEVSTVIREGDKNRIQKFRGLVMSIKGSGNSKTFTVRKISYGVGVEKIFPLNSTNISAIKILKTGSVRRAKLNYMRQRVGRLAMKVKSGAPVVVVENENAEAAMPEVTEQIEVAPAEEVAAEQPAAEAE